MTDSCPGSYGRARLPIGDDVVVGLVRRRDLDQLDPALAPLADGLDPVAGALVVMRLEILVVLEHPVALHQAEAARIVVAEGGDRLAWPDCAAGARSTRRRPDCISSPSESCSSAGNRRTACGRSRPRRYIEVSGATPDIGDAAAREERCRDVDRRLLGRIDLEPVGAGHGRAVEQGVDRWPARRRAWAARSRIRGRCGNSSASPPSTLIARPRAERP